MRRFDVRRTVKDARQIRLNRIDEFLLELGNPSLVGVAVVDYYP